jgi:LacI family transcriptional regulator
MKKGRVTLRDIAERASLSRTAVSLALRNHPSIPASTIARVKKIADELGFTPDPDVSKLMAHLRVQQDPTYQSTIAWLTAWPTEDGWHFWLKEKRVFAGAQARARQLGYLLEPFWLLAPGMTGGRAASILESRGIEAALVAPLPDGLTTIDFDWSRFSVAAVGHSLVTPDLHRIESAHAQNFEEALRHIRKRDVNRIGFIESHGTDARVSREWRAAYLVDQEDLPKNQRVPLLIRAEITQDDFTKWFTRHSPDVIISNEYPVIAWLAELGVKVPEDIGHVRLDCGGPEMLDRYEWGFSGTWPSGIDQMPEEVGATAVDVVVAQTHRQERDIPPQSKTTLVRGRWRDLETLKPPRQLNVK